jgi:hypothetical protein
MRSSMEAGWLGGWSCLTVRFDDLEGESAGPLREFQSFYIMTRARRGSMLPFRCEVALTD